MPGGLKGIAKNKRKGHVKVKKQKKKYMRSKDPLLAVFMWGVQHSVGLKSRECGSVFVVSRTMRGVGRRVDLRSVAFFARNTLSVCSCVAS